VRIVHLPFYDDNSYQTLLMDAQRELGHEVLEGGGGGNFLGVALREWRADIIHFHWLHPYLLRESAVGSVLRASRFMIEVALLRARGAKVAWTVHNLVNHAGQHAGIERWFSCLFAKLADACFVHSHAAGESAAERFGIPASKLHVIPHGNYIGCYPNEISREAARGILKLPSAAKVFLFLGRIEPYKGVFDLIDAFVGMPGDSHLVIAGKVVNPELLAELEMRCRDHPRIHFEPRRIPDQELQVFYNAADIVVFPFRQILTSGSLVLAMSFGKAVVAPLVSSLEEILPPAGVKWFVPTDPGSLSDALSEWIDSDPEIAGALNLTQASVWEWKEIGAKVIDTCLTPQ